MAETKVLLKTSKGDIVLELDEKKAPISVKNFTQYVKDGFYDGTIFHRVIGNFMIQGGGFDESFTQKKTRASIKNEAENGLKNDAMSIAMARTGQIDSATAQFFINLKDNDFLNNGSRDFGYAVFGKVVDGKEVVESIAVVKTGSKNGHSDVPVEDVVLIKAELIP